MGDMRGVRPPRRILGTACALLRIVRRQPYKYIRTLPISSLNGRYCQRCARYHLGARDTVRMPSASPAVGEDQCQV